MLFRSEFGGAGNTADNAARARALRDVSENTLLKNQEFNKAFVLMQYFGYLRRNPNDPPEAGLDFAGYNFWLDKLKELSARCRKHKLVDARGREIRFYQLVGCWGNPPDDYQQQLERQAKELVKLRKRYRVIEMTCNPSGEDKMRAAPPVPNP